MAAREAVVLSFIEYLQSLDRSTLEDGEQVDVAISALSDAFGIEAADSALRHAYSYMPAKLEDIFAAGVESLEAETVGRQLESLKANPTFQTFVESVTAKGYFKDVDEGTPEYQERFDKLVAKFQQRTKAAAGAPPAAQPEQPPPPPAALSAEENEERAEAAKSRGNAHYGKQEWKEAEKCYNEAIEACPDGKNSHIYYCNRAAALCFMDRFEDAVEDCLMSIDLKPDYSKAFARLGFAHSKREDWPAAVKAYQRAVELDPSKAENKSYLKNCQAKMREAASAQQAGAGGAGGGSVSSRGAGVPSGGGGGGGGGMPDLASLMGAMGGGGGGGGLAGMMNNPQMMAAAQQMMQNPQMMKMAQDMMSNPDMMAQAMGMLGGGGGGGSGGGGLDPAALAAMMGGAGGGGAAAAPGAGGGFGGFDPDMLSSVMGGGSADAASGGRRSSGGGGGGSSGGGGGQAFDADADDA